VARDSERKISLSLFSNAHLHLVWELLIKFVSIWIGQMAHVEISAKRGAADILSRNASWRRFNFLTDRKLQRAPVRLSWLA
jgi:hypothetical protein